MNAFIVSNYPLRHWQKKERSLQAILYASIAAASSIALTNLGYIWSRYTQAVIHIIKYEYGELFYCIALLLCTVSRLNALGLDKQTNIKFIVKYLELKGTHGVRSPYLITITINFIFYYVPIGILLRIALNRIHWNFYHQQYDHRNFYKSLFYS